MHQRRHKTLWQWRNTFGQCSSKHGSAYSPDMCHVKLRRKRRRAAARETMLSSCSSRNACLHEANSLENWPLIDADDKTQQIHNQLCPPRARSPFSRLGRRLFTRSPQPVLIDRFKYCPFHVCGSTVLLDYTCCFTITSAVELLTSHRGRRSCKWSVSQ